MKSFALLSLTLTLAVVSSKNFHGTMNLTLLQERVINGNDAIEGQFPYQVGLLLSKSKGEKYLCGGSLIDSEWVLTAAHCLTDVISAEVRLGSIYYRNASVSHIVDKKDIIPHEDFVLKVPFPNDIGLIKIPKVQFTQNIQKIDLPKKSSSYSDYAGENVDISGWGKYTSAIGSSSKILKYNVMKVISNTECNDIYNRISSEQICATDRKSRACSGDSGGPLVLSKSKVLVGIVSFGVRFCRWNLPSVFTRVTSYLDWIAEKTGIET